MALDKSATQAILDSLTKWAEAMEKKGSRAGRGLGRKVAEDMRRRSKKGEKVVHVRGIGGVEG